MTALPGVAILAATFAAAASAQSTANLGIFEGAGDVGAPSHKGSVAYDAARQEVAKPRKDPSSMRAAVATQKASHFTASSRTPQSEPRP